MAMIFQDPLTSLNPTSRIGRQLVDAQQAHAQGRRRMRDRELKRRTIAMLSQVGIPDAEERLGYYPHQFSGGMRQRIMIALALVLRPKLLIADEPTTSLDVIVEAQILAILSDLRQNFGTALLLITHNLGIVAEACDRVAVMYAGQIVEEGDARDAFGDPAHPYTRELLRSTISLRTTGLNYIEGAPPDLSAPPPIRVSPLRGTAAAPARPPTRSAPSAPSSTPCMPSRRPRPAISPGASRRSPEAARAARLKASCTSTLPPQPPTPASPR
jgi:peptide/nickel transport system ATP-binding protein